MNKRMINRSKYKERRINKRKDIGKNNKYNKKMLKNNN